jgi:ribose/xylose/arabinose/galactoside ABC-type transport system permease subunit
VAFSEQGMPLAMRREVVWKKVRDLTVTLAVLVVLFGMLMAINPRVREQFTEMTRSVQGRESLGPVQNAAYAAVSIGSDYAADNPFLFSFLVAAVVLFMLMLRS